MTTTTTSIPRVNLIKCPPWCVSTHVTDSRLLRIHSGAEARAFGRVARLYWAEWRDQASGGRGVEVTLMTKDGSVDIPRAQVGVWVEVLDGLGGDAAEVAELLRAVLALVEDGAK